MKLLILTLLLLPNLLYAATMTPSEQIGLTLLKQDEQARRQVDTQLKQLEITARNGDLSIRDRQESLLRLLKNHRARIQRELNPDAFLPSVMPRLVAKMTVPKLKSSILARVESLETLARQAYVCESVSCRENPEKLSRFVEIIVEWREVIDESKKD